MHLVAKKLQQHHTLYFISASRMVLYLMPSAGSNNNSNESVEDPRIKEIREINARLVTVISFLKAKQTPRSIESSIITAEEHLDDHTPAFIMHDSGTFEGTRHVGSLLQLCDALEAKSEMGIMNSLTECTTLLERKVVLLREVHRL